MIENAMRPRRVESRRILAQRRADNEKSLHPRYASHTTENAAARTAAATTTTTRNQSSSLFAATRASSGSARSATSTRHSTAGQNIAVGPSADTVGFDRAAEALSKPIHIPQYNPNARRQAPVPAGDAPQSQRAGSAPGRPYAGVTGYLNPTAAPGSARLTARSVAGSVMVRMRMRMDSSVDHAVLWSVWMETTLVLICVVPYTLSVS